VPFADVLVYDLMTILIVVAAVGRLAAASPALRRFPSSMTGKRGI
jgi:hypothetical protein